MLGKKLGFVRKVQKEISFVERMIIVRRKKSTQVDDQ